MTEPDNRVITTADLARALGIQPATLRNLKSKHRDRFIEGEHFVSSDTGNLWLPAGEALVRELAGVTGANDSPVTEADPFDDTPITEANQPDDSPITPPSFDHTPARTIARKYAEGIAYQQIAYYLPGELAAVYDRLLNRPTAEDRTRLFALTAPVNSPALQQAMNGNVALLEQSISIYGGEPE